MKLSLIILSFMLLGFVAHGQVGRAEITVDTIQMGGATQEVKEKQMEAQDELLDELSALRDTVSSYIADRKNLHNNSTLYQHQKDLDQMINALRASERNEPLIKRGYSLMKEVRDDLKGK